MLLQCRCTNIHQRHKTWEGCAGYVCVCLQQGWDWLDGTLAGGRMGATNIPHTQPSHLSHRYLSPQSSYLVGSGQGCVFLSLFIPTYGALAPAPASDGDRAKQPHAASIKYKGFDRPAPGSSSAMHDVLLPRPQARTRSSCFFFMDLPSSVCIASVHNFPTRASYWGGGGKTRNRTEMGSFDQPERTGVSVDHPGRTPPPEPWKRP